MFCITLIILLLISLVIEVIPCITFRKIQHVHTAVFSHYQDENTEMRVSLFDGGNLQLGLCWSCRQSRNRNLVHLLKLADDSSQ